MVSDVNPLGDKSCAQCSPPATQYNRNLYHRPPHVVRVALTLIQTLSHGSQRGRCRLTVPKLCCVVLRRVRRRGVRILRRPSAGGSVAGIRGVLYRHNCCSRRDVSVGSCWKGGVVAVWVSSCSLASSGVATVRVVLKMLMEWTVERGRQCLNCQQLDGHKIHCHVECMCADSPMMG